MSEINPLNDISTKVFDELFSRFQSLDADSLLVYLIDSVDESALVHLADQFHIMGNEGWLQAKTNAEKREIIKNAIELHRYKGTKYALIKVLNSLNIDGEIKEWFEYEGEPYFFKVILYIFTRPVDTETEARMLALINEYKNVRSHLDSIELNLASRVQEKTYAHISIGEIVAIQNQEVA